MFEILLSHFWYRNARRKSSRSPQKHFNQLANHRNSTMANSPSQLQSCITPSQCKRPLTVNSGSKNSTGDSCLVLWFSCSGITGVVAGSSNCGNGLCILRLETGPTPIEVFPGKKLSTYWSYSRLKGECEENLSHGVFS
jgi:hypothetical protein